MSTARGRRGIVRRAAKALRAWREERLVSATSLAERFGVTQQIWTAWERGAKRPSLLNALELEAFTEGAVRYEQWDYPDAAATFANVVARRACAPCVSAEAVA